jgi:hypothetical protein
VENHFASLSTRTAPSRAVLDARADVCVERAVLARSRFKATRWIGGAQARLHAGQSAPEYDAHRQIPPLLLGNQASGPRRAGLPGVARGLGCGRSSTSSTARRRPLHSFGEDKPRPPGGDAPYWKGSVPQRTGLRRLSGECRLF